MRNTLFCLALAIMLPVLALGGVRCYQVEPYQNCNGWTPAYPYNSVSQSFVCTASDVSWAEIFIGAANTPGSNVTYDFDIQDQATSQVVYSGSRLVTGQHYEFVRCTSFTRSAPLIKGKSYVLKVYHSGGESLNFYYSDQNPYKYGNLSLPGGSFQPPPGKVMTDCDLACRIEGVNRVIDSTYFGVAAWLGGDAWWGGSRWAMLFDSARSAGVTGDRECVGWGPGDFTETGHGIKPDPYEFYYWSATDTLFTNLASHEIQVFPNIHGVAATAAISSHIDSIDTIPVSNDTNPFRIDTVWSDICPPRGLNEPVISVPIGEGLNPSP